MVFQQIPNISFRMAPKPHSIRESYNTETLPALINKILVENQSLSAASSFKPSACLATRPHWASLCLSRTRGVQEGEPRASAGQSELARQNSHLARRTQRSP